MKAEVLNETAHNRDQKSGHAKQSIMLLPQLPNVLGPKGPVIHVDQCKLMLVKK